MKNIFLYFHPKENSNYFSELKTKLFIKLCFIGIVILSIGILSNVFQKHDNLSITYWSNSSALTILVISLFVLKNKGIQIAGNFFSLTSVISLLIFMNIIQPEIDVTYKFALGQVSVLGYIVFNVLYASRPIILINSILTFITTSRIYYLAIQLQPNDQPLFTNAYLNHTLILTSVALIMYYTSKFIDSTINKAKNELVEKEEKNKELLCSEEEARATNEELLATTEALVQTNLDLEIAKNKAEESDRLKTEFLNNMSHEVRTPMNGIIGFAQLLDMEDIEEDIKRSYIETIQNNSNQLLLIIDNIIEISKLGTKQVKVFESRVFLNNKLNEIHTLFSNTLNHKPLMLSLETELDDDASRVWIDEIKIYKILTCLIENAIRFTDKGSIKFGYKIIDKQQTLQFFVRDTGIGIKDEDQNNIFKKFQQADPEKSKLNGGLGLGLAIVQENTQLLGGSIELVSSVGIGSTFYINIPFKPVED